MCLCLIHYVFSVRCRASVVPLLFIPCTSVVHLLSPCGSSHVLLLCNSSTSCISISLFKFLYYPIIRSGQLQQWYQMCIVLILNINELLVELIKFCSQNLRDPLISNATMMPIEIVHNKTGYFLYHRLICSCAPTLLVDNRKICQSCYQNQVRWQVFNPSNLKSGTQP